MNQQMQSKGGWIASFMIVGAVLVLGLLAGLYYVKTRQIEESTAPVATEDQETSKSEEQKPQTNEDKDKAAPQAPADTENDTKPVDKQVAVEEPGDEATDSDSSANDQNADTDSNSELPATGPADAGAQFIALAALAVSGAAYVQSRRSL